MGTQSNLPAVIESAVAEQHIDMTNVNMILPTQSFGALVGEFEKVTMEVVKISPNPPDGEVFEPGGKGKGKALTKVPLLRIGNAIGLMWVPRDTTVLESSERKSRAKATALFRKANGEWIPISEEKTVDLDAIEEKQRISAEDDAEYGKIKLDDRGRWVKNQNGYPVKEPWDNDAEKQKHIDREVRKSVIQYRLYKDERAMTGAKERVIRAVLAIKGTYTDAELSRPFAFPRIVADVSAMMQNKDTRTAAIGMMTGKVAEIFGEGEPTEPAPEPEDTGPALTATVIEEDPADSVDPFAQPPEPEATEPEEPTEDDQFKDAILKLEEWSHNAIIQRNPAVGKVIDKVLLDGSATLEQVKAMIDRCDKYAAEHAKK
tara:strand:- start:6318 stop:7439 length:1122 start_codon:yes stop_codon:yes gene_type:complete